MPWLLCAVLVVWRPLNFALELLSTLPSIGMRGGAGVVELLFHGAVATISIAAARALWMASAAAPRLATVAVIASTAATVQSLYWTALPHQTQPDDAPVIAALAVAHAAFWLTYLAKSPRIRDLGRSSP